MSNAEKVALTAHDGHPLAATRFHPSSPAKAGIVFGPAMAVPQSFYAAFASHLAAEGYAVWTFDYRGTGESLKGSMRGVKADLTDWFKLDYDAVLQAVAAAGRPVFLAGHSFGGQVAPLLPSREQIAGLINIAVGSGSMRHNVPSLRCKAPLMWHVMAPLLCPLFGYFPGSKIGVIGDLPTDVMFQWRKWCLTPDYILSGEPGAREAYASAAYPVLSLFFSDDELLLPEGSQLLHEAYRQTTPDWRVVTPQQANLKRIGHFGFFKPASAAIWPLVTDWLEQQLASRLPQPSNPPQLRSAA